MQSSSRQSAPDDAVEPGTPHKMGAKVRSTLTSVLAALGWVLLMLVSLGTGLVALLTTLALGKQANADAGALQLGALAIFMTFGLPFALAAWKHHDRPRRIRATMTWLPAVWNVAGLLLATQLIPDVTATALRNLEWVAQGRFGDSHPATRMMSALGHESADMISPPPPPAPLLLPTPTPVALDRSIKIPFNEQGTAIMLGVELEGPDGARRADYLFDTGASYTTLTSSLAAELGIEVPDDAPTLEFNTASGLRESRMVYLPKLRLEDVEIDGLLVSVCDSCANERTQGLLGLNVMREFFVQMDYQAREMQLLPRVQEPDPNRSYDIEPVVGISIEGRPEIWLGRVRWIVLVENTGTQAVHDVVPRVVFNGGPTLLGAPIDVIEPGAIGRSLVVGKVAEDGQQANALEFTLTIAEAHW